MIQTAEQLGSELALFAVINDCDFDDCTMYTANKLIHALEIGDRELLRKHSLQPLSVQLEALELASKKYNRCCRLAATL